MGISVIGLALAASFGLCFYMQIFYADMHPIIPFLLLGIGVDDMFVIVQVLLKTCFLKRIALSLLKL
jgi:Niemann-Pick C1 protein